MSDFLTRLAQRSMGAAPLIAPRLPSLFAPAEESNDSIADTTAVTDAAHSTTLASTPLQSHTTGRTDHTSVEARANIYPTQHLIASETANAPAPASHIDSTPPRVEAPLVPLVETTQANSQAAAPLLAPVAPQPVASLDISTAPRKQDTPAAAPEPWLPLLPQRKAESTAAFPAVADDNSRGADNGTPPAPTVHITIGRVEVRANIATPPAAPRPRAASQPALSLSDYLKRGAGAS